MNACPSCGRQSEDRVAQCPQCGTALARPSASPPPTDSDRPALLKAFRDEFSAQAAAQALLASGLPSSLRADNCGGAYPGLEASQGFQLFVRANDLERARELLVDFEAEKPEVDAETAEQAKPELDPAAATTWTAGQKARLWFLAGLGTGIAITTAILIDNDTGSPGSHTGVTEDDTDGDGRIDMWTHYRRGRMERREVDRNYDGKPDEWILYEGSRMIRVEADGNFDGTVDGRSEYANGRISSATADLDFDGQPDVWTYYRDGAPEREEWDRNRDGKPDAWSYFSNGLTTRYEVDQNFDGRVDGWTQYSKGWPAATQADTDFNGRPDVTYQLSAAVTVSADWVDQDSGRLWKRETYRNGYLHEEFIDTDRNGTFDTKITYDAFANPIQTVKLE